MTRQNKPILFIPDAHWPFGDYYCHEQLLTLIRKIPFQIVVIGGDWVDNWSISRFSKDVRRMAMDQNGYTDAPIGSRISLEWEHAIAAQRLREIDEAFRVSNPSVEKYFLDGNHEQRLYTQLGKDPEIAHLVNTDFLGLAEHGWQRYPYRSVLKLGKLRVVHDLGQHGKYAAFRGVEAIKKSVVINHVHKIDYHVIGDCEGDKHVGCSFGWIGDFDKIDYMAIPNAKSVWAHGIGTGFINEESGLFSVMPHPFLDDYQLFVDGYLFKRPSKKVVYKSGKR